MEGYGARCELNDEFTALNERTIPNIEDDLFPEPAMLEEDFVEGNELMREMVDVAPAEIRADLDMSEWAVPLRSMMMALSK